MWLLYVDESGNVGDHQNFVLGGVAIFEGEVFKVTQALDDLAVQWFPSATPPVELHVRELRNLSFKEQGGFSREAFFGVMDGLAQVVRNSNPYGLSLFGSVVHAPSLDADREPYLAAFEDMCSRFNMFLVGRYRKGDPQKGLVILDYSCQKENIRRMVAMSKTQGDRWGGHWVNLPEVPLFVESHASRLVQLADFVAHCLFRRYESGESRDLDKIMHRFHREDGIIHGIGHIVRRTQYCMCAACVSRMGRDAPSAIAETHPASLDGEFEPPQGA